MPWILVWVVVMALARVVRRVRTKTLRRAPRGLCAGCSFVHMQYGATDQKRVFCTFGGGVRLVKLDVLYCTDYRDRDARPCVVRIGFAPDTRVV